MRHCYGMEWFYSPWAVEQFATRWVYLGTPYRFTSTKERDEWVSASENRTACTLKEARKGGYIMDYSA